MVWHEWSYFCVYTWYIYIYIYVARTHAEVCSFILQYVYAYMYVKDRFAPASIFHKKPSWAEIKLWCDMNEGISVFIRDIYEWIYIYICIHIFLCMLRVHISFIYSFILHYVYAYMYVKQVCAGFYITHENY